MARRYIGKAVIYLDFVGSHDPHDYYNGTITAGKWSWAFKQIGVSSHTVAGAADNAEHYDAAAAAAASFGSYWGSHNRGRDVPDWAPPPEVADAIEDAVSIALNEQGNYVVLRKPPGGSKSARRTKQQTHEGEYLVLIVEKGGMRLVPTPLGVSYAKKLLSEDRTTTNSKIGRMIYDHMLYRGWAWVSPESIGALTDAPIIRRTKIDASGRMRYVGPPFAHMDYQVEDPIKTWSEGRQVWFVAG